MHLSYEELSPLMSNDITEEERLMQQLIVAKQVVHELTVWRQNLSKISCVVKADVL